MDAIKKRSFAVEAGTALLAPGGGGFLRLGLRALLEKIPTNDLRVAEAMREQDLEELVEVSVLGVLESVAREHDYSNLEEDERPTPADVVAALEVYGRGRARAGGRKKARLLDSAFFSYFNPKFYSEGMSMILMKMAEEIEYPEAFLIRRAFDATRAESDEELPLRLPVESCSLEASLALRLERQGLGELVNGGLLIVPAIGVQLMEFVFANYELEPGLDPAAAEFPAEGGCGPGQKKEEGQ